MHMTSIHLFLIFIPRGDEEKQPGSLSSSTDHSHIAIRPEILFPQYITYCSDDVIGIDLLAFCRPGVASVKGRL